MTPYGGTKMAQIARERDQALRENKRLREALQQIVLHADMPAGESWEQAYIEVTSIARSALGSPE